MMFLTLNFLFLLLQLTEHKLSRKEEGISISLSVYCKTYKCASNIACVLSWILLVSHLFSIILATEEAIRRANAEEQNDIRSLRFVIYFFI